MMDWTDRHCRYFLRLLSRRTVLYTEMVTTDALLHGDQQRFLQHDNSEHPLVLQLGGSKADKLAECAQLGAAAGYDEINLNIGCPSNRVQSGRFGACLMAEPALVAKCVTAMRNAIDVPVTVKTRIGIDELDSLDALANFISHIEQAGCETVIIHARKAHLQGLSPKENRTVPPLNYDFAYRIKQLFPAMTVVINGGISSLQQAQQHLQSVDGVMLGRSAYHNPYLLAEVDSLLFANATPIQTREEVMYSMLPYIERELKHGSLLKHITRHMLGLFQGMPGARHWRRHLSEQAPRKGATAEVVLQALSRMQNAAPQQSNPQTVKRVNG